MRIPVSDRLVRGTDVTVTYVRDVQSDEVVPAPYVPLQVTSPVESDGLSNMRDRVESLGGRLSIESEPGRGTRVTAVVPQRRRRDVQP